MTPTTRLTAGFVAGAALDAVILLAAINALVDSPSLGSLLGVVLVATWAVSALAGARSVPVALDVAGPYSRTHAAAGLGLAIFWATDPQSLDLGIAAVAATIAGAVVLEGRREALERSGVDGWTWTSLRAASAAELSGLLRRGSPPRVDALLGRRYRALALGPFLGPWGRRKAFRAFFHAPHGPPAEGCERAALPGSATSPWRFAPDPGDGPDPGWFVVERRSGLVRLDWRRSRRNRTADPRRGLSEVLVQARAGDPTLLLSRRFRRAFGLSIPLGWYLLEDAGAHQADGTEPDRGPW